MLVLSKYYLYIWEPISKKGENAKKGKTPLMHAHAYFMFAQAHQNQVLDKYPHLSEMAA